jgi:hypothetical protein
VTAFANAADHRNYDRILALFTEDGVFARQGASYAGRNEIRSYLESRPTKMTNRHFVSNFELTRFSETAAEALAYYTVYRTLEAEPAPDEKPLQVGLPAGVGEFHARFRLIADGWRMSHLEVRPVFVRPI